MTLLRDESKRQKGDICMSVVSWIDCALKICFLLGISFGLGLNESRSSQLLAVVCRYKRDPSRLHLEPVLNSPDFDFDFTYTIRFTK